MPDSYDVIVIGAGTGGYSTALRAASLGKQVALVERDQRLGGTCLLRGCIPTKALLQSAAVMDEVNRSEEWGISASGQPEWPRIQEFKDRVVDKLVSGLTSLIKARKVEVVNGRAKLVGLGAIVVVGRAPRLPPSSWPPGRSPSSFPAWRSASG
jgi:pyruvate/2-oxoglutarate dehydrogenase complex dihydrolipoamide dehydrogenase (E3) component